MKSLIQEYDRVVADLDARYPPGARVEFYIMHGQRNPSTGVIIGSHVTVRRYSSRGGTFAYALIRIRHDQAKPGSRYPFREVAPENIVGVFAPTDSTSG